MAEAAKCTPHAPREGISRQRIRQRIVAEIEPTFNRWAISLLGRA
jgi:hypothetical protein